MTSLSPETLIMLTRSTDAEIEELLSQTELGMLILYRKQLNLECLTLPNFLQFIVNLIGFRIIATSDRNQPSYRPFMVFLAELMTNYDLVTAAEKLSETLGRGDVVILDPAKMILAGPTLLKQISTDFRAKNLPSLYTFGFVQRIYDDGFVDVLFGSNDGVTYSLSLPGRFLIKITQENKKEICDLADESPFQLI